MIYVSSACRKNDNIGSIIQEYIKYGIKNIELSGGTGHYDMIEDDLMTLKHKYGVKYACHAYFPPPKIPFVVNLASCNEVIYQRSIDHYIRCIEMLRYIDCPVLSIHAGFLLEVSTDEIGKKISNKTIYDKKEAYERFFDAYRYISKSCADNGIVLYLENNVLSAENYRECGYHNHMMMTDYDSIMEIHRELGFNLLLDLGHLYVSSNTLKLDFSEQCSMLKKHVKWIHLSDNDGIHDGHKPLRPDSTIMKGFNKIYDPSINVTLETKGSMEEILAGMELIEDL